MRLQGRTSYLDIYYQTKSNARNEREDNTTDPMAIKRIIREHYKQFYAHTFDNLDEMHQFLEKYNLPKLTQEETANLNRSTSIKESESILIIFQNRKCQAQMGPLVNSTKILKKKVYQFSILFQRLSSFRG